MRTPFSLSSVVLASALMLALLGGGCATDGSERTAAASPLKNVAKLAGFATEPREPADFVKASRDQSLDFTPVGVTPAPPKNKKKPLTPAELKALEDALEAVRVKNEGAAGVP
jgi:hypothetical protein